MPEDILLKTAPRIPPHPGQQKLSAIGILIVIILGIVLILLGERLLFDLNRWINPIISTTYNSTDYYQDYPSAMPMSMEKNVLAPGTSISYPTTQKSNYLTYKLLIHAALIIPVFLLIFLLYYVVKMKQRKEGWRAAIFAYMAFAFWMMLHLLEETFEFVASQYQSLAIYIILGILAVILTPLAIFLQKKHSEQASA